ncbi:MAG: efflux RND transporter permease subunit [Peptococcaceae bacterium]|jgi:HAE1 family hydrophobic/amphiphilic exporter-1|nr:efflux RND transporter permease subunit [Peptococcaceae bacterium]
MKNIAKFAIHHPASMIVLMAAILIMGFMNFTKLPVDLLPDMDLPIVGVITTYQGAGPEEVEDKVTKPLENVMGTISGIDTIRSRSGSNSSLLIVQFNYGTNMDNAMIDIRDKVSMIEAALPENVTPTVIKFDPNMMPVIQVTLSGNYTLTELQRIAEDDFESRLARIPEVASVSIGGGRQQEIKVLVDPVKVANYGLSLSQVSGFLQQENYNMSSGSVLYGDRNYIVRSMQQFANLEDIENVAITTGSGQHILLKDIASVEDGYAERTSVSRVNGEYAVEISCQKETDANTVDACAKVRQEIAQIMQDHNLNVEVDIVMDQSEFIQRSISSTGRTMLEGGILAVLIILVFLRNISSTLIIACAIPMSIIATFIVMYYNGSTLNVITLGGLALGIGRIVDDSIVAFENIYRHRVLGKSAFQAAIDGIGEVGGAVLASTLTLLAVFIPIGLAEGIAGVLFKPLALTICVAIFCSLIVALTIVPFLSSRILTDEAMTKKNASNTRLRRSIDALGNWIDSLNVYYQRILRWALGHRKMVIIGVSVLMLGSLTLTPFIGAEFMPASDSGSVAITLEADKGATLDEMEQTADLVEKQLIGNPLVDVVSVTIGSAGYINLGSSVNTATVNVKLVPLAQRRGHSAAALAAEFTDTLSVIPGVKISASVADDFGGGSTDSAINVSIRGDDLTTLRELSDQALELVKQVPGTREIVSSLSDGDPEVQVLIDRNRAANYNLTPRAISTEIRTAIDGTVVSKYHANNEEVDIRLALQQTAAKELGVLTGLKITTPTGGSIPLSDVATFDLTRGPVNIARTDLVREATISGDILGRDLNSVIKDIQTSLNQLQLPPGYEIVYTGANEQMLDSFSSLLLALLMAIMLVYVVLVIQYESFFDPFIILFSIPTSFIGIVLSLFITGRTFNVSAFIGIIMLAGIVVANAIVFIDYLKQRRAEGIERTEAIVMTGGTRLRPILMTSLCTILAMVPMATGFAEGSETNAPLATVVIGGLLVSTFITLVLIPVVYTIFDDQLSRFKEKRARKKDAKAAKRLNTAQ